MTKTMIATPLPTNRTVEGPRITYNNERLIVEYDWEGDGESLRWAGIVFVEAIFCRFFDISCCEADHVLPAEAIRRQNESELLSSVLSRWNESVGHDEWQKQKGGSARFSHFTVFFDDAGAADVVASDCSVLSSQSPGTT